jgi:hypothetical protein
MVIRRLVAAIREQDWPAVTVEFLMVVVGVFLGIQVSNWNEDMALDREFSAAMRRVAEEIDLNLADLATLKSELNAAIPVVREGYNALLTCVNNEGNLERVNAALNMSLITYGMNFERRALDTVLDTPDFIERLPETRRASLAQFSSFLKLIQGEITINEIEPFKNGPARAPSVGFGPASPRTIDYGGKQYRFEQRNAFLTIPISESCSDNQLMKGFWLWERLQGGILVLAGTARDEMENQRQSLQEYL